MPLPGLGFPWLPSHFETARLERMERTNRFAARFGESPALFRGDGSRSARSTWSDSGFRIARQAGCRQPTSGFRGATGSASETWRCVWGVRTPFAPMGAGIRRGWAAPSVRHPGLQPPAGAPPRQGSGRRRRAESWADALVPAGPLRYNKTAEQNAKERFPHGGGHLWINFETRAAISAIWTA